MTKKRIYILAFVLLFIVAMGDALTGGTFTSVVTAGMSVCSLFLYAYELEETAKHGQMLSYW